MCELALKKWKELLFCSVASRFMLCLLDCFPFTVCSLNIICNRIRIRRKTKKKLYFYGFRIVISVRMLFMREKKYKKSYITNFSVLSHFHVLLHCRDGNLMNYVSNNLWPGFAEQFDSAFLNFVQFLFFIQYLQFVILYCVRIVTECAKY